MLTRKNGLRPIKLMSQTPSSLILPTTTQIIIRLFQIVTILMENVTTLLAAMTAVVMHRKLVMGLCVSSLIIVMVKIVVQMPTVYHSVRFLNLVPCCSVACFEKTFVRWDYRCDCHVGFHTPRSDVSYLNISDMRYSEFDKDAINCVGKDSKSVGTGRTAPP